METLFSWNYLITIWRMPLFVCKNTKWLLALQQWLTGSAKGVIYVLVKNRLFCFLPNLLSPHGIKPVMYIRKVTEVAWVHLGWRKFFIWDPGVDWEFLTLLLFPWWAFWDEMWAFCCRAHFCWDSFPCCSFLRVALWNVEGCPVPPSTALQTPSLCTLQASAVRSADVSTNWGSGWPSVLRDWFIPLFFWPQLINIDERKS